MGSYLEMALAISHGLEIASLAGRHRGREDDVMASGQGSGAQFCQPCQLLISSSLTLGVSFRHCLYAIAWLRHHKYFSASATGRETPPTNLSPGPHYRELIRLCSSAVQKLQAPLSSCDPHIILRIL